MQTGASHPWGNWCHWTAVLTFLLKISKQIKSWKQNSSPVISSISQHPSFASTFLRMWQVPFIRVSVGLLFTQVLLFIWLLFFFWLSTFSSFSVILLWPQHCKLPSDSPCLGLLRVFYFIEISLYFSFLLNFWPELSALVGFPFMHLFLLCFSPILFSRQFGKASRLC